MASATASVALPLTSSSFTSSQSPLNGSTFSGLQLAPSKLAKKLQCSSSSSGRKAAGSGGRGVVSMAVTLPVLTFEGEAAGEVEMDLKSARPDTAKAVVHRGVICELQNRRRGTASTLTRAEVRGGGRKPYKQKGTGRARQGSIRTPLRPGGGVVFGPKPKDWSIKINKKEKRLAISTALQSATVNTVVVEDLDDKFTVPKTKDFIAALKRWGVKDGENSLLFAMSTSETLLKSSRNVSGVKILTPRSLNLYDVLRADKLILTKSAVEYLEQQYGASTPFEFTIGDGEGEEEDEEEEAAVVEPES